MTQEEKAKSYDGILTATNVDKKFQYCKVPKFKVGDYIKHNKFNIIFKVISVNSCYYYVENVATGGGIELFNAEQNFHLWTIQDAKDGDVLAVNGKPFICYHTDEYRSNYCCIDDKGCFRTNIRFSFEGNCILPATKEQRDLLFQKMKETGYEWDEEKKEVKKIEQKPKWTDDDKQYLLVCKNALRKYQVSDKWDADIISKWLEDKLKQGELKPKWTEEDEKCIDNCCLLIGAADDCYEKTFKDDCIHYLQSLKERIAWKPMPIKQKDIDDLVFDFKWSSENFKNKRVTDIYRQGIYDVMELLKQRMG